jgi:tight adherence protein B
VNPALLAAAAVAALAAAVRPFPPSRDPARASSGSDVAPARRAGPSRLRPTTRDPQRRKRAIGPEEVARWCDELARATRSGSTLAAAVRTVAPPRQAEAAVARVTLALDRGAPLLEALDRADHTSAPDADLDADFELALTVLRACAHNGGPPGEPIDRAAATLRGRAADAAERRTHSAQARMSAVVMTCLPVAMLGLLLMTSGPVRSAVVRPSGAIVVAVGGLLNVAGWRWMRRIIGGGQA